MPNARFGRRDGRCYHRMVLEAPLLSLQTEFLTGALMMFDNDGMRDFELRVRGEEMGSFGGATTRAATAEEAASRAAMWLEPESCEEEAESRPTEISLEEKLDGRIHLYRAWTWEEETPDDSPEWLGETLARAEVEPMGVEDPKRR